MSNMDDSSLYKLPKDVLFKILLVLKKDYNELEQRMKDTERILRSLSRQINLECNECGNLYMHYDTIRGPVGPMRIIACVCGGAVYPHPRVKEKFDNRVFMVEVFASTIIGTALGSIMVNFFP